MTVAEGCNKTETKVAQVSVIMPVYNCLKVIPKAFASLQEQTVSDLEILIIDDQSTDGTYELLQSMSEGDPRIKLFRTPRNLGSSLAKNITLNKVTGEWITLLDADDWYEPDRIEILLNAAKKWKADLVIDNLQIFDHAINKVVAHTNYGSSQETVKLTTEDIFRGDNPLIRDSIGYSRPMICSEFLRKHNIKYWGKYRNNEDFIFLTEIIISGARAFIIPQANYIYRHSISPSTKRRSPHSHSPNDTARLIAQACDDLMEKYGSVISAKSRRSLQQRKKIFLTSEIAGMQTSLLAQGRYGEIATLIFRHPYLLIYRLAGIRNRLHHFFRMRKSYSFDHSFGGETAIARQHAWLHRDIMLGIKRFATAVRLGFSGQGARH